MKQTILIHGRPDPEEFEDSTIVSPSNAHWFPWLQKQLALQDEICQSLEFPFVNQEPVYKEWVATLESFTINSDSILVGHSLGGGFILKYLSENPKIIPKKAILVAPWIDPEKKLSTNFFDFVIDPNVVERVEIHVFMSSDDSDGCLKSFEIIEKELPRIHYHKFTDKEHFCTKEFPELLEVLK